jgi:hypothetical protein
VPVKPGPGCRYSAVMGTISFVQYLCHEGKMKKIQVLSIVILIVLMYSINVFAENKIFYADLDGDKKSEKVILSIKDNGEIDVLSIQKNNKVVFSQKDFDHQTFEYVKIVKFTGITVNVSRDVMFMLLGGCDTYLYVISYETAYLDDGGKHNNYYRINKHIAQVDSCY